MEKNFTRLIPYFTTSNIPTRELLYVASFARILLHNYRVETFLIVIALGEHAATTGSS